MSADAADAGPVSELQPRSSRNREDLARVERYFETDDVPRAECEWVQDRGLGILHAELVRLRRVVARYEATGSTR